MFRVFVDASVLYSAITSATGASRELLRRHLSQEVVIVVSAYVTEEVRRNLAKKAPTQSGAVDLLLDLLAMQSVEPSIEQIQQAATYTELKDAPVVAAAIAGVCEYLLTFDRKHLIDPPQVAVQSKLIITTPDQVIKRLRDQAGE